MQLQLPRLPYLTWDGAAHTKSKEAQLEAMVRAYLATAFTLDQEQDETVNGVSWDGADFSAESQARARFDCAAFLHLAKWSIRDWTPEDLGVNFWLTRNHHGTGFWDRDTGTEASRNALTELATLFGEQVAVMGGSSEIELE